MSLLEAMQWFTPLYILGGFIFLTAKIYIDFKNENRMTQLIFVSFGIIIFVTITYLIIVPLWLQTFPADPQPDLEVTVLDSWSKIEPSFFSAREHFYIETEHGVFETKRPYSKGTELTLYYDNTTKMTAEYKVKEG